jgi:predicted nucleotide-binding protein
LVPFLVHYLDQQSPSAVATPKLLAPMFEELRVRPPANLSDVLRKSKMFVRARTGGYRLSHEGRQKVLAAISPESEPAVELKRRDVTEPMLGDRESSRQGRGAHFSKRNVLVVYGRNQALRRDLFSFLRAINLNPLEFEEMARHTGSTSPFTLEVLETAFENVQACVVLLSPDESVTLRPELRGPGDSTQPEFQPRPNVLIEAGMAMALQPNRTILIRVGNVRSFSDFDGKQYVNLTGSAESRNKLLNKLHLAECDVKSHGDDWLTVGDFQISEGDGKK